MLSRRSVLLGTAATLLVMRNPWPSDYDRYEVYFSPSHNVAEGYLSELVQLWPGAPIYSGEIGRWNGIVMRDEP